MWAVEASAVSLVWGGTVQALWLWARRGVFHLPWAQQEASAELRGIQKETPQPGGWCQLVRASATLLYGTGGLLPIL